MIIIIIQRPETSQTTQGSKAQPKLESENGRKAELIFQAVNKRNLIREDLDVAKKKKP